MHSLTFFLVYLLTTAVSSSFTDCAPETSLLTIDELSANPNSIVAVGQPVTFRILYTVPRGLYIPSANVDVTTIINGYVMPIQRSTYSSNPLTAKQYNYTTTFIIPLGVSGRIHSVANFYNASGTQLMCARWIAFVKSTTNSRKKIGWLTSLFS
jgi:hypothetical protein